MKISMLMVSSLSEIPHEGPMADLVWSDPDPDKEDFAISPRSVLPPPLFPSHIPHPTDAGQTPPDVNIRFVKMKQLHCTSVEPINLHGRFPLYHRPPRNTVRHSSSLRTNTPLPLPSAAQATLFGSSVVAGEGNLEECLLKRQSVVHVRECETGALEHWSRTGLQQNVLLARRCSYIHCTLWLPGCLAACHSKPRCQRRADEAFQGDAANQGR